MQSDEPPCLPAACAQRQSRLIAAIMPESVASACGDPSQFGVRRDSVFAALEAPEWSAKPVPLAEEPPAPAAPAKRPDRALYSARRAASDASARAPRAARPRERDEDRDARSDDDDERALRSVMRAQAAPSPFRKRPRPDGPPPARRARERGVPARLRDAARYTHYTLSDPDLSAADARQMRAEAHAFLARLRTARADAPAPGGADGGDEPEPGPVRFRPRDERDATASATRPACEPRGDGRALRAHQLREDEEDVEEDVTAAAVWTSEEAAGAAHPKPAKKRRFRARDVDSD